MNTFAEEKHMGTLSGFIFLCNGKTKPECYIYRVFGLPDVRRDVVENIKPGMKLFLFDFELKLLYGVYEATSTGRLNMEPTAFGGKFPAQVGFRIFQDCFPLHESSFKHAIEDNYQKGKFRQELNGQQVQSLLSLFRPFTLPTSLPSLTLPPQRIDNLSHVRTSFSQNDPSQAVVQGGPNLSIMMPRHARQGVESQQYAYDGLSANIHPPVGHQTLPASEMNNLENPYAVRIPYVNDQNALSSQHVSYGTQTVQAPAGSYYHDETRVMANSGYVPHSIGQQQPMLVPASLYNPASTQQTYTANDPHYRYWHEAEVSYSSRYPQSANLQHISSERNHNIVHPENAVHSYSSWWPVQDGQNNASHYYNAV